MRALSWIGVWLSLGAILLLTWTSVAAVGSGCLLGIPCNAGHPIAFATLGAPMAGVFATSTLARMSPRRTLLMAFLALWIIAAVDELVQPYVGRDASLQDWALDMVGGVVGFLGGSVVLRLAGTRLGWFPPDAPPPEASVREPRNRGANEAEAERRPTRRRRRRR
ncbi:MAG: VanZ family protein [Dehalococcoidia bacterium]